MDIDFNANKNNFFANNEYKGLKLKNKGDEIKVLRMLKKYADEIKDKMNEKDKILSDHNHYYHFYYCYFLNQCFLFLHYLL